MRNVAASLGLLVATTGIIACAMGPQRAFGDVSTIPAGAGFFCTRDTTAGPTWSRCDRVEAECVATRHQNRNQSRCERAPTAWCLATFEGTRTLSNVENVCMSTFDECKALSLKAHDYRSAIDATTCIEVN